MPDANPSRTLFAGADLSNVRVLAGPAERERVKLAEAAAKCLLLVFGEVLVAEEDHLALVECVAHELDQI